MQDQIKLGSATDPRIYQVRLTREGSMTESKGYVMTLDDMSELITAQRNSAWADVARRIAHEIKNPLTPIQLSAERLRRRYGSRLEDDFEVFDKCTNTIIRQVGDIGKMVDEFSSFARMPAATQDHADLSDTIRHVVFLESVRQPEIELRVDLPETPITAYFDHRLVSQALTNIIKNAVEALEMAGLSNIENPRIVASAHVEGDMVRVEISDNGIGWPKENRHQLLEPYVTSRGKGHRSRPCDCRKDRRATRRRHRIARQSRGRERPHRGLLQLHLAAQCARRHRRPTGWRRSVTTGDGARWCRGGLTHGFGHSDR
nr:histidine kinase dimerization/phospho-acceptor domain-containing protein [uncultured Sphaerochaeta sp.]